MLWSYNFMLWVSHISSNRWLQWILRDSKFSKLFRIILANLSNSAICTFSISIVVVVVVAAAAAAAAVYIFKSKVSLDCGGGSVDNKFLQTFSIHNILLLLVWCGSHGPTLMTKDPDPHPYEKTRRDLGLLSIYIYFFSFFYFHTGSRE